MGIKYASPSNNTISSLDIASNNFEKKHKKRPEDIHNTLYTKVDWHLQ